jgi:catechol 2,3-dioxygenase-like lactoylglutathione lyase family enzyme
MAVAVRSMIAATYVRDIDASRAFYRLLGFHENQAGQGDGGAWSVLRHRDQRILLASTQPSLDLPPLPLLFYFFVDDLDAVAGCLGAGGAEVVRVGYPPHAPGGEAKVRDPDGNTVLLGQRERSPSQPPADDHSPHFSVLQEAAALLAARGGTTAACQVTDYQGEACRQRAEVKLADSRGDTVWACLAHADEVLVAVPGAFLASQEAEGITGFLVRRRASHA